jgi:hypothetical protein
MESCRGVAVLIIKSPPRASPSPKHSTHSRATVSRAIITSKGKPVENAIDDAHGGEQVHTLIGSATTGLMVVIVPNGISTTIMLHDS